MDLAKLLQNDDKYKEVLDACTPEEREFLEKYMQDYMASWQKTLIDPMLAITKDKEKSASVGKELKKILNKDRD